MDKQTIENEATQKKGKKRGLKIAVTILLLLLLLFGIHACTSKPVDSGGLEMGVIDQDLFDNNVDRERLQAALNQQVEAGMVNMFMNTNVDVAEDGSANWLIQNVEQNQFSMQIDVRDSETGTLLYSSPVIDPGYKIEFGNVIADLPEGTHPCVAEFSIIDQGTSVSVNRIGLKINVTY